MGFLDGVGFIYNEHQLWRMEAEDVSGVLVKKAMANLSGEIS